MKRGVQEKGGGQDPHDPPPSEHAYGAFTMGHRNLDLGTDSETDTQTDRQTNVH